MTEIKTLLVKYHDLEVGTLSLSPDKRNCVFEYSPRWLVEGFSISPLELPLKKGVFVAKSSPFNGNFGIFEDCLPDGYGRYLLSKALKRKGIKDSDLSALHRLSIVGERGMGALTFTPSTLIDIDHSATLQDFDMFQEIALEVLKEQQDSDAGFLLYNSQNSGGARPKAVFQDNEGHWLVKFRHIYDPKDIGRQEYDYMSAAKLSGIDVPDFKLINNKYFAVKRFDIDSNEERIHIATAGGLLNISLQMPVLDYNNLLALTGWLTQDPLQVEQMYRRMIFNYLTDNKDDHCKNFSFMVLRQPKGKWRWQLAPAYDLTFSPEGYNGEHATSVNGTGQPTLEDFIAVGKQIKISDRRCRQLIEEVREGCKELMNQE